MPNWEPPTTIDSHVENTLIKHCIPWNRRKRIRRKRTKQYINQHDITSAALHKSRASATWPEPSRVSQINWQSLIARGDRQPQHTHPPTNTTTTQYDTAPTHTHNYRLISRLALLREQTGMLWFQNCRILNKQGKLRSMTKGGYPPHHVTFRLTSSTLLGG
jgi:hypothetical protein